MLRPVEIGVWTETLADGDIGVDADTVEFIIVSRASKLAEPCSTTSDTRAVAKLLLGTSLRRILEDCGLAVVADDFLVTTFAAEAEVVDAVGLAVELAGVEAVTGKPDG